jgi:flagellar biosynthesis chaperone FliJ
MAKRLNKYDYELLLIALEKWHNEIDNSETNLEQLSKYMQELGEHLAKKQDDTWGLISRYDRTR